MRTIIEDYSVIIIHKHDRTPCLVHPSWDSFAQDTFSGRMIVTGKIYHSPNPNIADGSFFTSEPILTWTDTWFKTEHTRFDETFFLGTPSPLYAKFLNAVKREIPIIYYWESGINSVNQKYLSGLYLNLGTQKLEKFCQVVRSYDLHDETLTLDNNESVVFVDWNSQSAYEKLRSMLAAQRHCDDGFQAYSKPLIFPFNP